MEKKLRTGLKFLFIASLLITSFSLYAGVTGRLIDVLVSTGKQSDLLAKIGIKGAAQKQTKTYIKNALDVLVGSKVSVKTLGEVIQELTEGAIDAADKPIIDGLQTLLKKNADDLSEDQVVDAINKLIYIANRHGRRGTLAAVACTGCMSDVLSKKGFKYSMDIVQNAQAKAMLTSGQIPLEPRQLRSFLGDRLGRELTVAGQTYKSIGDWSRVTPDLVDPAEERALGLFLMLAEGGTEKQKKLIGQILEISKKADGAVDLLDPGNKHKLWLLFAEDMDDKTVDGWIDLLGKVSRKAKEANSSKKKAFFAVLEEQAGDDEFLKSQLDLLKKKKCFFP